MGLLNKRTELVLDIGKLKKKKDKEAFSPSREETVYRNIKKENQGPLSKKAIENIYKEIMSAAISLQKKVVIGYLGPEATFTHEAARSKFGGSVDYLPLDNIGDIFSEVEKGHADYGVVPIENSIEGAVTHTFDMFVDSHLKVCSEIKLKISHNLLGHSDKLDKIKKIYSNPQVFGQCRIWLKSNFNDVELLEVESTAKAALKASRQKHTAAIASRLAGSLYGLHLIREDIEDVPNNTTRFLAIGNKYAEKTGNDKTSIMFAIKDKVGALYDSLNAFKEKGINLTMIESRPSKKKTWDYYFFADFNGHCEEIKVKEAIEGLKKQCIFVKILGSYPKIF